MVFKPVNTISLCVLPALALLAISTQSHAADKDKVQFNRDIRPILADKCFACHGPDKATRKAKLRLDIREEATKPRDFDAAITPGDPAKSSVIERVFTDDEDDIMPPLDSNRKVTKEQIELLKRWIDEGAEYSNHWAFDSVKMPQVPAADKGWVKNPIDNFVITKLSEKKLTPNKEADKRTLLRRLSLDLTGLPPTPADMKAFLEDNSTCLRFKFVTTISASQRVQRIVLPSDLSSLIMSRSNLSSFSHVGHSLGSFRIVIISLTKIVLPML